LLEKWLVATKDTAILNEKKKMNGYLKTDGA